MYAKLEEGRLVVPGKVLKYNKAFTRSIPETSYVEEEVIGEDGKTTTISKPVATYHDEEYEEDVVCVNPREEDFIEAGYKLVEDNRLEEKEGYYQVPEYSEDDEYIYINYHYEEIPDEQETIA